MSVSVIRPAPLVSVVLCLGWFCWPDVRWQRFMFPAVSHTSSSAWAEQQLDEYLTHSGWDESITHSDTFKGASPFSNVALWWWWWWRWFWLPLVVLSLCACCWSVLGWASLRLSSVGGGLWNKVKMPSPFCSWRAARPERPLSDTTRDTLQLDSLQMERQVDCTRAAEQDGGDVSGSYKRKKKWCQCRTQEIQRPVLDEWMICMDKKAQETSVLYLYRDTKYILLVLSYCSPGGPQSCRPLRNLSQESQEHAQWVWGWQSLLPELLQEWRGPPDHGKTLVLQHGNWETEIRLKEGVWNLF